MMLTSKAMLYVSLLFLFKGILLKEFRMARGIHQRKGMTLEIRLINIYEC